MAHPSQLIPQRLRDFLKCCQCRKEHKKCSPRDRDWISQREKCDRCDRLGHPCGPPTRKKRSVPVTSNVTPTTSQLILAETRSYHEGHACLVNLAVIISTLEILLSRRFLLNAGSSKSTSEMTVTGTSGTLNNAIKWVHLAFVIATQSVKIWLQNVRESEREPFGSRMACFDAQYCDLRRIESSNAVQAYVCGRNRRTLYMSPDTAEARILSCTSRVFHDCHTDSRTPLERPNLKQKDYLDLELHIRKLFLQIEEADNDGSLPILDWPRTSGAQGLNIFPASHIAFFNQDCEIALSLWKEAVTHVPDVDIFGSPFPHIVAASKDCNTLAEILRHAPGALQHIDLGKLVLGNDPNDQAIRALLCREDLDFASGPLRSSQQRRAPANLTRFTEMSKFPYLSSMLRNHRASLGVPEETLHDLDNLRDRLLDTQNLAEMNMNNSMGFDPYLPINQHLVHGCDSAYGQSNFTFQPAQPLESSLQPGQSGTYCSAFDLQFPLRYSGDGFDNYGGSGG